MSNIDDLFKKPNRPLSSAKRKFEAQDAQEVYKAVKISSNGSPNGNHINGASVEDAEDDDTEAGPARLPEDEGDDEEGRFFGGGVTRATAEALDYVDEQDGEGQAVEKIDSAWLRRLATSFEKKVARNAELRARYENDPQKFMASEADLDAEIKSWSLLSEHSDLYTEFAASESLSSLVGLLAHENTDIAIAAMEIISELLDEDVAAEQSQWDALSGALLDADLQDLLMSNLKRLDEDNEADRNGVYHSLAVLEALASQTSIAERIGKEEVLMYLCNRMRKAEKDVGQNKQYAAEVLQVLLQSSALVRRRLILDVDGVDLFLRLISAYRIRNPDKDSLEEEYAENLFDSLNCVVDEPEGKDKFVEAEGVELCLIMLKVGTFSRVRALRVVSHAVAGNSDASMRVCERFVEAGGLKTISGLFMKKADNTTVEHILGLFSALLLLLPEETPARIRTLAKLTEREFEKVNKLVQLRREYAKKSADLAEEINLEKRMLDEEEQAEREDEWYSRSLDGGLFCLQTIDMVLAWLVTEDDSVKKHLANETGSIQHSLLKDVEASLRQQLDALGSTTPDDLERRDLLGTLVNFVRF